MRRLAYSLTAGIFIVFAGLFPQTADSNMGTDTLWENFAHHPDGLHVIDGSFVMTVNELNVNITNHGLIGSQFTQNFPYSHAPSGQWPAGTGMEYLWAGGIWIGGKINNDVRVSTGQYEREFRPGNDVWSTMYEARDQALLRPGGNQEASGFRLPDENADDDRDGRIDEEILNGRADDNDGLVDEDFGQIGDQMMVCTMYDNTRLANEIYPDHEPLNLEVVQTAAAFSANDFENFIALRYHVTNIGATDITDLFFGFFADCDIGPRDKLDLGRDDRTGYFEGMVRSSNKSWAHVRVGYMYDAGDNPLPGYFGVTGLGKTPFRSYRYFRGNRTFEAGGLPIEDFQRYDVMSRYRIDRDFDTADPYDYSFLMSSGNTELLPPGESMTFDMALVVGEGLDGLLEACANADLAYRGAYFDLDNNPETGVRGREFKECFDEIPLQGHHYYERAASLMQYWCSGGNGGFATITESDFVEDENGQFCIWLNVDNCTECSNRAGIICSDDPGVFWGNWNCWDERLPAPERLGCTGIAGRESRVPWIDTRIPPPSPGVRVWPQDNSVHVFWNDKSEFARDFELEMLDFESYRIWRADNWKRPTGTSTATGPGSALWGMLAEYDLVNDMLVPIGGGLNDTVPLGQNTGLEVIAYRPVCLDNPMFADLAGAMKAIVDADVEGLLVKHPTLRDRNGTPIPGLESLLQWETHPAVLDTFFWVAGRPAKPGVVPKRGEKYYEYVDREVHNGFLYYYSVTATDRHIKFRNSQPVNLGYGLSGSPNSSFTFTTPATTAQTPEQRQRDGVNIYVFPNPATREALAEFQQYFPAKGDATGVRIVFANLPEAHNRIRIYTASGDEVIEIHHDGTDGYGMTSWNLVSQNGQEVVSGIYLYSVESDRDVFDNFVGRFVIVR